MNRPTASIEVHADPRTGLNLDLLRPIDRAVPVRRNLETCQIGWRSSPLPCTITPLMVALQSQEVAVQLTQLAPVRDGGNLIGWTARFTDQSGLVRIATLGLHCVMDPSAFAKAVAAQGIQYCPPNGSDKLAWQNVVHELRRRYEM